MRYLIHGGGGPRLYAIQTCPSGYPPRRFARSSRGFLFIRAKVDELRALAVNRSGRVIDRVSINP